MIVKVDVVQSQTATSGDLPYPANRPPLQANPLIKLVVCTLLVLTAFNAYGADPDNGGFEDGLTGWPEGQAGVSLSSNAHGGTNALSLAADTNTVQVSSPLFAVTPHASYRLTSFVKQTRGEGDYQVTIAWLTAQEKVVGYDNDWFGQDKPREYTRHGTIYTAPLEARRCRILLGVAPGVACLFDDVALELAAPAPALRFKAVWLDAAGAAIRTDEPEQVGPSKVSPQHPAPQKGEGGGAQHVTWEGTGGTPVSPAPACSLKSSVLTVNELQYYTLSARAKVGKEHALQSFHADFFAPRGAAQLSITAEMDGACSIKETSLCQSSVLYPRLDARPYRVWMCPDFRTDPNPLFPTNAPWAEARGALAVFKMHMRVLALKDAHGEWKRPWNLDVPKLVQFLRAADKPLALEAAGIYGELGEDIGIRSADRELELLDRVYAAGGRIASLGLDDPISRVLKGGRKPGEGGAYGNPQLPLAKAIAQLVAYFKRIHEKHPEIEIGIIPNTVWWDFEKHQSYFGQGSWSAGSGYELTQVLDELLKALDAAGERLAFIHIDTPYDYLTATHSPLVSTPLNATAKILAIEKYCRRHGIRFGLIYNSEARRTHIEAQYGEETLKALHLYRAAGGQPDDLIVESWYDFTKTLLPETNPVSLTRLTLDVARQAGLLYPHSAGRSINSIPGPRR